MRKTIQNLDFRVICHYQYDTISNVVERKCTGGPIFKVVLECCMPRSMAHNVILYFIPISTMELISSGIELAKNAQILETSILRAQSKREG